MKEIPITAIEGIRIGQVEDPESGTGCTVLISETGMAAGIDIRGGGPASRDVHLLDPLTAAQVVHAVVLGGGSAFGLDAAGGVMKYLEEKDIGFDVGITKVPLVAQSDIFDLTVGDPSVRPDHRMGYEAARIAFEAPNYRDGNAGAGCGATVGKLAGMETCMKTGIGSFALEEGDFRIGAIVVVNALGDIYDAKTGEKVAGLLSEDRTGFRDSVEMMKGSLNVVENRFTGNTTIGAVITNGRFTKAQLCKIASMAHNGYARSIRPVHTSADGDSIYALSTGDYPVDHDVAGTLAAEVMSEAILRAVESADSAFGYPAAKDLKRK
ncbi:MAG: P1 family peptidase [Firmicutes bacterium]|nr:P1 family peptidase [Bacillota bacterium]